MPLLKKNKKWEASLQAYLCLWKTDASAMPKAPSNRCACNCPRWKEILSLLPISEWATLSYSIPTNRIVSPICARTSCFVPPFLNSLPKKSLFNSVRLKPTLPYLPHATDEVGLSRRTLWTRLHRRFSKVCLPSFREQNVEEMSCFVRKQPVLIPQKHSA